MKLAAVRSIGTARGWRSEEDAADFEQEIIDQHALAMAAAGLSDGYIAQSRAVVFEFRHHLDAPVWQAKPSDADAFLAGLRRAGLAVTTRRRARSRSSTTSLSPAIKATSMRSPSG